YLAGFSLTITPGKSGEALRSIFLKDHNVSFRKSFGAFFSERLSDLISVIVLASSGLWMHPDGRPILIIVAAIVIFLLYAIQKETWIRGIERMARKTLPLRFSNIIEFSLEMLIAFRSCFTPRILISGMVLGVLAWGLQGLALYYILEKLNFNIDLLTSLFIYGFSLLVGALTLLPGGLGGTEVTMVKLLTLHNVPASSAVAVTLIIRLATLWFSVILGILALPKKQKT
nr:flippase-like domain-containing protein [Parachlamydiaceae bacterium]